MRILLFSALAVFAAGLFDVRPASAGWSCVGAEYVCGKSVKSSARSHRSGKAHVSRAHRKQASYQGRRASKAKAASRHAYKAASKRSTRTARATSRSVSRSTRTARATNRSVSRSAQTGVASYYWQGQRVASGGRFNPNAMTAAHRSLPFGTRVRVTHLGSGRTVDVTINDRGPFIGGRIIDLSRAAAGVIGMRSAGVAKVRVDVIGRG